MTETNPEFEGVWLEQMYVFPDKEGVYEHDTPYVVEFEATTGETRTRELSDEEAADVRKFNKIQEARNE